MNLQLIVIGTLMASACTNTSRSPVLLPKDTTGIVPEVRVALSVEDSLDNSRAQEDHVDFVYDKEQPNSCPQFIRLVQQYWNFETSDRIKTWESSYDDFKLLVEEAQCMLGLPLSQLEETLGSYYESNYIAGKRYVYYWLDFSVIHSDRIVKVRLNVMADGDTDEILSISHPTSFTITLEKSEH